MIPYKIDFQDLRHRIEKLGYSKILLQLPEGMKIYATEIADELSDYEVFISANPCYGSCDIEVYPDFLTIQFGHAEIPNISYPDNIIFVEAFSTRDFKPVAEKFLEICDAHRIGIVASVQHVNAVQDVASFFKSRGREVFIGKGDARIRYPGQVLGCNFSAAREINHEVDCFVFLGTGHFHAVGVSIATGKKTYVLDPYTESVEDVEKIADRIIRQRFGLIVKAEEADRFGIIVSSKIGQRRVRLALALKEMIESTGRKAYMIMTDNVRPENMYYDVDAYVNTACPRLGYDDISRFRKPVLTPIELEIALKFKLWEQYAFDEIVEVDK